MVMSVHLSIGNNEEDEKTKLLVKWNSNVEREGEKGE